MKTEIGMLHALMASLLLRFLTVNITLSHGTLNHLSVSLHMILCTEHANSL